MPPSKNSHKKTPLPDTDRQDTRARVAAKEVNRKVRDAQVMDLRVQGYAFAEIARIVGYSDQSGAYKAWKRALADIPKAAADEQREHLRIQLEDVSKMLYARVRRGDARSAEVLVRVHERYCRMLGLDLEANGQNTPTVIQRAYPASWIGGSA